MVQAVSLDRGRTWFLQCCEQNHWAVAVDRCSGVVAQSSSVAWAAYAIPAPAQLSRVLAAPVNHAGLLALAHVVLSWADGPVLPWAGSYGGIDLKSTCRLQCILTEPRHGNSYRKLIRIIARRLAGSKSYLCEIFLCNRLALHHGNVTLLCPV